MDIQTLLWMHSGTHDKVWGIVRTEEGPITFWGRRGAQLTFKKDDRDLYDLTYKKERKGYDRYSVERFEQITPGFTASLRQMYIKARLRDRFHGEPEREAIPLNEL